MTRRLPACAYLWPVRLSHRVGKGHGDSHRCAVDVGHREWHQCACGYRLDSDGWRGAGAQDLTAVQPEAHTSGEAV